MFSRNSFLLGLFLISYTCALADRPSVDCVYDFACKSAILNTDRESRQYRRCEYTCKGVLAYQEENGTCPSGYTVRSWPTCDRESDFFLYGCRNPERDSTFIDPKPGHLEVTQQDCLDYCNNDCSHRPSCESSIAVDCRSYEAPISTPISSPISIPVPNQDVGKGTPGTPCPSNSNSECKDKKVGTACDDPISNKRGVCKIAPFGGCACY